MTNIRCKGNKEIDLLAINPKTGEKFHIESRVRTKQRFRLEHIDSLAREKFEHSTVKERIREFFGDSEYRKWLVIQPQKVDFQLDDVTREKHSIEIRYIDTIMRMIMKKLHRMGSRDHVLRTLELVKFIREFDRTHGLKPKMTKPRVR